MDKLSNILIIDDDPTTSYLHKVLLKNFGVSHQIETATDGEEALQEIKDCIQSNKFEKIPQLILLEIDMPERRGYEFLEAYQNLEFKNKASVVVAVLTCSISRNCKNRVKKYSINDYIVKPLTEERMLGLMERHFGWHSREKSNKLK